MIYKLSNVCVLKEYLFVFSWIFYRSEIKKQAGQADLLKNHYHHPESQKHLHLQHDSVKFSNKPVQSCRTMTPDNVSRLRQEPITSTVQKSSVARLSNSGSKLGSPIPCGDSFFEDDAVLTQTHVNFMSSFSRHSLNGSLSVPDNNSTANSTPVSFPRPKSTTSMSQRNNAHNLTDTVGGESYNNINNALNISSEVSFISPNRPLARPESSRKFTADFEEPDMFDSIDEEMNLNMAEDFAFDYKVANQSSTSRKTVNQSGNSVIKSGDNYPEEYSKDEIIDIFDDDDEDFNAVLSQDDLPQIAKPNNCRQSTGLIFCFIDVSVVTRLT